MEEYSGAHAPADGSPTPPEVIRRNLSKTGGTPFNVIWDGFSAGENIFFPISEINALRRRAAENLTGKILAMSRREISIPLPAYAEPRELAAGSPAARESAGNRPEISVLVYSAGQIPAVLSGPLKIDRLILEMPDSPDFSRAAAPDISEIASKSAGRGKKSLSEAAAACRGAGVEFYIALPMTETGADADLSGLGLDADGFLIRAWGQMRALKRLRAGKILDYTLPAWNAAAAVFLLESAGEARLPGSKPLVTVSPEHDPGYGAWGNVPREKIVYGRIPLMVTRQCPVGNFAAERGENGFRCGMAFSGKDYALTDRKGAKYPILRRCAACGALIMSPKPVAESPANRGLRKYASLRLIFSTESAGEIAEVLQNWASAL